MRARMVSRTQAQKRQKTAAAGAATPAEHPAGAVKPEPADGHDGEKGAATAVTAATPAAAGTAGGEAAPSTAPPATPIEKEKPPQKEDEEVRRVPSASFSTPLPPNHVRFRLTCSSPFLRGGHLHT